MGKNEMTASEIIDEMMGVSNNDMMRIVKEGTISDIKDYIDTGSYLLNAQISCDMNKGIPTNRTVVFGGLKGVGKTLFARQLAKNILQKYDNSTVIWWRNEDDSDKDFIEETIKDSDRVIDKPFETIEEFKHEALKQLERLIELKKEGKEIPPIMWVLDSLGNMVSNKELQDTIEGKDKRDMTKQQLIKATFRMINLKLSYLGIPFIVLSHVYTTMDFIPQTVIGNGNGAQYAGSIILTLTKAKYKEGKKTTGVKITSTAYKNRLAITDTKVPVLVSFKKGIHQYYGLVDYAIEFGIWKKSGNKIEIEKDKVFEKEIYKNPKKYFTDDIMNKLNEYFKEKFSYNQNDEEEIDEEEINEEIIDIENENK